MRAFILRLNLLCLLAVCLFACDHRSSHPVLHRADSLLKARQPDSAMILLKSLPAVKRLPKADRAYYAILLASATDKLELPLLPCDTLLNFALDYYSQRDYERAWALLYKGRLLEQMDDEKSAIEHSLEALEVLQDFPKDTICRRLIYSSLGLWYGNCMLYDKALEVLGQSLQYSLNARDTAIDYNNFSFVYAQREMKDSAIFYQQKVSDYALLAKDTNMIITAWYDLSMRYGDFGEADSALFYAQLVVCRASLDDLNYGRYCHNLGDLYLDKKQYDSACYYLEKSLLLLDDKRIAYWSLADLEAEQGNYEKAYYYLDEHVQWQDSFYHERQITEVQHLVYKHQTESKVKGEHIEARKKIGRIIFIAIVVCFVTALIFQYRVIRKDKEKALYQQSLKYTKEKLLVMQQRIEENEAIIALLREKDDKNLDEIEQKEQQIENLRK
ncbi:MAG: hypothetical protein Q4D36_10245, partial [Bacteroidales bacterium]|nr:hypothetical protein [Bacteroidales bacterium]